MNYAEREQARNAVSNYPEIIKNLFSFLDKIILIIPTWINPNIIPTMAQEALDNVQAEIAKTEAIINS